MNLSGIIIEGVAAVHRYNLTAPDHHAPAELEAISDHVDDLIRDIESLPPHMQTPTMLALLDELKHDVIYMRLTNRPA